MQNFDFSRIVYRCYPIRKPKTDKLVTAIGIDSEADREGKPFLFCLSDGTAIRPSELLKVLFTRKYRGHNYVVFNLKYEQGAILADLDSASYNTLRQSGECQNNGYKYKVTGYKCLRITRGKNAITFWDMHPFFQMSLASAARQFTNLTKLDQDASLFTPEYVKDNWHKIVKYCVQDARITAELFKVVLAMAAKFGIKPTTFYSQASIAYKYFRENTDYVTVKDFWDNNRDVLKAACAAYSGGKFEVVYRGKGHFYEYDINSAYPYEIANLIDTTNAIVKRSVKYQPKAVYAFLKCSLWIKEDCYHPVAIKQGNVNIYPVGHFTKWVTKQEYDYLVTLPGAEIKILRGIWLFVIKKHYPYRDIIHKLYKVKREAKVSKDKALYHFAWKLTNSIYGKFLQLIPKDNKLMASTCWMPIYGAIITANVRIRIAKMQQKYPQVAAVHTDSVIADKPCDITCGVDLGEWSLTVQGLGVLIGCGCYQIADKVRLRGFPFTGSLIELLNKSPPIIPMASIRVYSWRQVSANNWDVELVNRFVEVVKELNINFDTKRDWSDTWQSGSEAMTKPLYSMAKVVL